jgi:hypothetical protein
MVNNGPRRRRCTAGCEPLTDHYGTKTTTAHCLGNNHDLPLFISGTITSFLYHHRIKATKYSEFRDSKCLINRIQHVYKDLVLGFLIQSFPSRKYFSSKMEFTRRSQTLDYTVSESGHRREQSGPPCGREQLRRFEQQQGAFSGDDWHKRKSLIDKGKEDSGGLLEVSRYPGSPSPF